MGVDAEFDRHAASAADRARQGHQDVVDRLRAAMDTDAGVDSGKTITEPPPAPRSFKPPWKNIWKAPLPPPRITPSTTLGDYLRPAMHHGL